MSHSPFQKPVQLSQLLQSLVRRKGLAEQSTGQELESLWKSTAGERVAAKSFVRRLKSGVLEVGVTNGAILEELTCYLKHELLPALQRQHPEPPIESLKFVKVR
jgi:predicted nucleic acid-binding Zn ribbon protein